MSPRDRISTRMTSSRIIETWVHDRFVQIMTFLVWNHPYNWSLFLRSFPLPHPVFPLLVYIFAWSVNEKALSIGRVCEYTKNGLLHEPNVGILVLGNQNCIRISRVVVLRFPVRLDFLLLKSRLVSRLVSRSAWMTWIEMTNLTSQHFSFAIRAQWGPLHTFLAIIS